MTDHRSPGIDGVRAALDDLVDRALGVAEGIADALHPVLDSQPTLRRGDLACVEEAVSPALEDPEHPVQGGGFVAEEGLLGDVQWWLEWFATGADGRVQRLVTHSEPQAISYYEYHLLPWYSVPRATGRSHVTGPYVDYLCTEEYTLTFTTPVLRNGRFAGVAGADVAVSRAERELLPALRAAGSGLAVVNADGRILCSNSGRHVCGDLLPLTEQPERTAGHAGLPLFVVPLEA